MDQPGIVQHFVTGEASGGDGLGVVGESQAVFFKFPNDHVIFSKK